MNEYMVNVIKRTGEKVCPDFMERRLSRCPIGRTAVFLKYVLIIVWDYAAWVYMIDVRAKRRNAC